MNTNCEETKLEIEKTESIKNLIQLYCSKKGIEYNDGLYLTKMDAKKIDENLTINEINILKNETLYIFEGA